MSFTFESVLSLSSTLFKMKSFRDRNSELLVGRRWNRSKLSGKGYLIYFLSKLDYNTKARKVDKIHEDLEILDFKHKFLHWNVRIFSLYIFLTWRINIFYLKVLTNFGVVVSKHFDLKIIEEKSRKFTRIFELYQVFICPKAFWYLQIIYYRHVLKIIVPLLATFSTTLPQLCQFFTTFFILIFWQAPIPSSFWMPCLFNKQNRFQMIFAGKIYHHFLGWAF